MLVSFIFATVSPAMAAAVSPAMAAGIIKVNDLTASATSDSGVTGASTIYFGNYWQGENTAAGKSAIAWKVLQTDASNTKNASGTSAAGITLLTEKAMYAYRYNPSEYNNWKDSEIRATLNGDGTNAKKSDTNPTEANSDGTYGTFAGDAFNNKEFGYILTTINEVKSYDGTSTIESGTEDKLFLLSYEEVKNKADGGSMGFKDNNDRIANATAFAKNNVAYGNTTTYGGKSSDPAYWWLRSPGNYDHRARAVGDAGSIGTGDIYPGVFAARSALNLDKQSVIFLSAAAGGKGDVAVGDGFALADYDGADGWKLTLTDTSIAKPNVTQAEIVGKTWDVNDLAETAKSGTKIIEISDQTPTGDEGLKIAYNGATTGDNMYVSALLKDSDGNYVNYAKVSQAAADTKIIGISGITPANYTLCIYGEQENGEYMTDYASALSEHAITIPAEMPAPTVNKILNSDYAAEGLTAKISNDCELGFEAGEYDTAVTIEDGKSGKITADATDGTTLTGAVTVKENATLATANEFTLKGDNTVDGTVTGDALTIAGGTTTVNETGSIENDVTIQTAGTVKAEGKIANATVKEGGTLELNADKYGAAGGVENPALNGGTFRFTGGTLAKAVTGEGTTKIAGNVTAEADIATELTVDTAGELTASADSLKNNVTNSGIVNFTGGTLAKNYTSTGTTNFKGKTKFSGAVSLANSTVNFYLDGFAKGDTIVETGETIDLADTTVKLTQTEKGYKLAKGETITLITKAGNYNGEEEIEARGATGEELYKYTYGVGIENDALMLSYLDQGVADQTKSFSEARLGASAALNSASDLVAGQAIDSASSSGSWEAFAAVQGSHNRYETGSHIDLNSTNVAAGLSKKVKDNITLGLFVEGGNGRYTTENEFEDGNVRADGDVNYFGGGVFAKVEGKKTAKGQLHGEASFRAGHMSSDYNSETFNPGESTRFDTSNAYMGAHAGLGYKWSLKDNSNIDTYVKYLWNRQNSDTPTIAGEQFDLDAINSHRLRAGFRYNGKENENGVKFFGGLAYEYEFDGTAKGHMGEYALLEPDFKGGSGMAELGIKYHKANSLWKVELGVTGYTGKRDSIGANLSAWYEFGK